MAGRTGRCAWFVIAAVSVVAPAACESGASDAAPARRVDERFGSVVMPAAELPAGEAASLPPSQRDLPGIGITVPTTWTPVLPPLDTASPVRFSVSNRKQRPLCTSAGRGTTCDRRTLRRLPPSTAVVSFEWLDTEPLCPTGTPKTQCSLSFDGPIEKLRDEVWVQRRTAPGSACAIPGADRTVTYRGWTKPPDGHEFAITACIRGPRFHQLADAAERAMRTVSFLRSPSGAPPTSLSP